MGRNKHLGFIHGLCVSRRVFDNASFIMSLQLRTAEQATITILPYILVFFVLVVPEILPSFITFSTLSLLVLSLGALALGDISLSPNY